MVDIAANSTTTATLHDLDSAALLVGSFSGEIESAGDRDWIKVELTAGNTYRFYAHFLVSDTIAAGDSKLVLRDSTETQVASNDDNPAGLTGNSLMTYTAAVTGTFFIDIGAAPSQVGAYSLFVTDYSGTDIILTTGNDSASGTSSQRLAGDVGADFINIGAGFDALGEQGNDILVGNANANLMSGGLGDDTIDGGDSLDYLFGDAGNDVMTGGNGGDFMRGGPGVDFVLGGADNDTLFVGTDEAVGDVMNGGPDEDTLEIIGAGNAILSGFNPAMAIEFLNGNGQGLFGTAGANSFDLSALVDISGVPFVDGKGGNDSLVGSNSNDVLIGGAGRDILFGGLGTDDFDFNSTKETKKGGARDRIQDFQRGQDDIDLDTIDAKTGVSGNQKFKFIGKRDFSDKKAELRYEDNGSTVVVQGDVNGDGKPDLEIYVKVGALGKGDFVL